MDKECEVNSIALHLPRDQSLWVLRSQEADNSSLLNYVSLLYKNWEQMILSKWAMVRCHEYTPEVMKFCSDGSHPELQKQAKQ